VKRRAWRVSLYAARNQLLPEDSPLGGLARDLFRWLTPHRVRDRIAVVLSVFAAERRNVFFIQIGSNDGDHGDPLKHHVVERRWSGIMIEPVPYVFERLRANYGSNPRLILEKIAIGPEDGSMPFYYVAPTSDPRPMWYDQLGSFLRANITKHAHAIPSLEQRIVETTVSSLTFESLCRKYLVQKIDLLHIDAEGFDFEIVKLIDFAQRVPDLLLYEHRHLSAQDYSACRALLGRNGYDLLEEGGDTLCLHRGAPGSRLTRVFRLMKRPRRP
jgi:FkbM family methyltransferase